MRKWLILAALMGVFAAILVSSSQRVSAQGSAAAPVVVKMDPAGNQVLGDPASPNSISAFTVSNPYCYQPDPAVDDCRINFRVVQATDNQTTSPFMTWLTFTINGKTRYSGTAFFEASITYTYDQLPGGLKVSCGAPNAGGAGAAFGNVYSVSVTPLDSSHKAMSTDIANLTCPAFAP